MDTKIDEITDGIYRISTYVPDIAPPAGFTFNQFLIVGEDPLLFHCGPRAMFPVVSEAVSKVLPPESLRWITFGHVEADECGAMNLWLRAAPNAEVAHGALGFMVSLNDMCDRPPRALADGEVLDLGGKRVRHLDTAHVPHNWESRVLFEETTGTLLCGDLLSQLGGHATPVTDSDLIGPAMEAEAIFQSSSLAPSTGAVMRKLGDLRPSNLAVMHGSSFAGDGGQVLHDLADEYEKTYRLLPTG